MDDKVYDWYRKLRFSFFTECSNLVNMVSSPTEWSEFSTYLRDFQSDKKEFISFSLLLISHNANVKVDNSV